MNNPAPDILASYLPRLLRQRIAREPTAERRPGAQSLRVAALFADLSGFTKLTVDLSSQGRRGSERVSEIVNEAFQALITEVTAHGGDLLTLSGDAVLAIWPLEDGQDLAAVTARAAACGLAARDVIERFAAKDERALRVKIAIASGPVRLMEVGGVDDRWLFLAAGEVMRDLGQASELPGPGEVVLHRSAREHVSGIARAVPRGDGWLLESMPAQELPESTPPPMDRSLGSAFRPWVSRTVLHRLDAGQADWVAELRQVSVLFLTIPRIDVEDPRELAALNRAVRSLQSQLAHYGGAFQDLVQDDKGLVMMASFGVPPFSHENDPLRAVLAGLGIQEELRGLRLEHHIGVATGQVFCGVYGDDVRRQHAVVGAAVNRAARLMQGASGNVLCDPATAKAAGSRVRFAEEPAVTLKGFPEPIRPRRALWAEQRTSPEMKSGRGDRGSLVGRTLERETLSRSLAELCDKGTSSLLTLEGEAGIGKSMLVARLIAEARAAEVGVLVGLGDEVERGEPWFAMGPIVEDLLDIQHVLDPEERREAVRRRLEGHGELLEWAPLLNGIVPLSFPENETTRQMSGVMRSDSAGDLVVYLLEQRAAQGPTVMIIDDAHWVDSASWSVIRAARKRVDGLMTVISTRPPDHPIPELDELLASEGVQHLRLRNLEELELTALVADRLGVVGVHPSLVGLVTDRSGGNPFFAEELALALREGRLVTTQGGVAQLSPEAGDLDSIVTDGTIHGIVTSRLDRLPAGLQLTLKVASVLGRTFSEDALRVLLDGAVEGDLSVDLAALAERGMLARSEDGTQWAFRHALTQEAAYGLITFGQRKGLHTAAAAFVAAGLEGAHAGGLGLLAHHLTRAESYAEAVEYLDQAAQSALREGANREAIEFVEQARGLCSKQASSLASVGSARDALWTKITGDARLALGDIEGADRDLRSALQLLGAAIPTGGLGFGLGLLGQLLRQGLHLLGLVRVTTDPSEVTRLTEAARAASLYSQVRYFSTDIPGWVHACLLALNLAERADNSPAAGRAYGGIGNLVATLGLDRLASRYFSRAEAAEDAGGQLTAHWAQGVVALTRAEWGATRRTVGAGLTHAARVGHHYEEGIGLTISAYADFLEARLSAALVGYRGVLSSARQRDNSQHEGWALTLMVPVLVAMDRGQEALETSLQAEAMLHGADPLSRPIHRGTSALALQQVGRRREALAEARVALDLFLGADPVYTYLPGYDGMLTVLISSWRNAMDDDSAEAAVLAKEVKKGLGALRGFARLFPFARPRLALYTGLVAAARGQQAKAEKSLRSSAELAAELGLRRDEGRARFELGKLLGPMRPAGEAELLQARELFSAVEARLYLSQLEGLALLSGG